MHNLGKRVKSLRTAKAVPLRTVAAYLDIDQAILSKIERGHRKAGREQVLKLAAYFEIPENELLLAWLSDKVLEAVADETLGLKAIQDAAAQLLEVPDLKPDRKKLFKQFRKALKKFPAVKNAWVFGSFARKEETPESDINLMIEPDTNQHFTLFDIAEIQQQLQQLAGRRVDVVMRSGLKPEMLEAVQKDLKLLYEA